MSYGVECRLRRFRHPRSGKIFLLALDATLFSGLTGHLADSRKLVEGLFGNVAVRDQIQGILAFSGFFRSSVGPNINTNRIISATASTILDDERDKTQIASVTSLLANGADCIGIHLSLSHSHSGVMLAQTGEIIAEAHGLGFPALVAAYVSGIDPEFMPQQVIHAALIARDLGADIIKISYPGSTSALTTLVTAVAPTCVVVAGGPHQANSGSGVALRLAEAAALSGAGICFGRSIFEADDPTRVVAELGEVLHRESGP
jgi:2-amino-4,5-dihydroxy-6-oxo-7-(phosphonooxy)heptanoate synthase